MDQAGDITTTRDAVDPAVEPVETAESFPMN